jgi:hypothetical protein
LMSRIFDSIRGGGSTVPLTSLIDAFIDEEVKVPSLTHPSTYLFPAHFTDPDSWINHT